MTDASIRWLNIGENRSEWARLIEGIETTDFFQLWPVYACAPDIETQVVSALADRDGSSWLVTDIGGAWPSLIKDGAWRTRLAEVRGWVLWSGSASPEQTIRAAAWLNERRDVIREWLHGPLIVVAHPLDWRRIRLEATDLWSVHIDVIRLTAPALRSPPEFPLVNSLSDMEFAESREGQGIAP